MKTAYLTGATGCIGRNLADELLRDGWRVVAACRPSPRTARLAGLGVEVRAVDLADRAAVMDSMPERVDGVFHVAASVSHWRLEAAQQYRDNVVATRNLVAAALARRAGRLVFTSTGATNAHRGCDAAAASRIPCQYVRTKRQSELELEAGLAHGLDAVVTKPGIVIGAYDWNNYSQIFAMLAKRPPVTVVLPGVIEFCHARDIARAHISAWERGRRGQDYTLGGHRASWLEVYQRIAALVGGRQPTRQTPLWVLRLLAYPLVWQSYLTRIRPPLTPQLVMLLEKGGETPAALVAQARDELGYQSAPLDEMLADCHRWMLAEGLLPPAGGRQPDLARPARAEG